eukprot:maker-scaffold645_size120276-snap-gene-0.37 protein:Tk11129 transcript:maker-scaffold645_size120276-snap-gene-0.37-mRNA-1 annotation:"---NA---"
MADPRPGMKKKKKNSGQSASLEPQHLLALLEDLEWRGFQRVPQPDARWQHTGFKFWPRSDICRELDIPDSPGNRALIKRLWRKNLDNWASRQAAALPPTRWSHSSEGQPPAESRPYPRPAKTVGASHSTPPPTSTRASEFGPGPPPIGALRSSPAVLPPPPPLGAWRGGPPPPRPDHYPDWRLYAHPPPHGPHWTSDRVHASGSGQGWTARSGPVPPTSVRWRLPPAPRTRSDPEELQERSRAVSRAQATVQAEIETLKRKAVTLTKVALLKDRLKDKIAAPGSDWGPDRASPLNDSLEPAESASDGQAGPGSLWHLNSDLRLSTEDYRRVGAGAINIHDESEAQAGPDETVDNPTSVAVYSKTTEESGKMPHEAHRVANAPLWKDPSWCQEQAQRARARTKFQEQEEIHVPITKRPRLAEVEPASLSSEDQAKYEEMAKKLKMTMVKRHKSDLKTLVDSPTSMKRVLMAKFFHEHRDNISKQVNHLRFKGKTYQTDAEIQLIEDLEKTAGELDQVDLDALPDLFLHQVEKYIQKEALGNPSPKPLPEEDEIVEVPVPPKPPAPVVDLESDTLVEEDTSSSQSSSEDPSPRGGQSNTMSSTITTSHQNEQETTNGRTGLSTENLKYNLSQIEEEEISLMNANRDLMKELSNNHARLEYLRNLRMALISSVLISDTPSPGTG